MPRAHEHTHTHTEKENKRTSARVQYMCFFLRVVIINTKSAVVWVWPLQSLYSSERDLNKQTLLLPALPRIKWERLWCTRGSFTYRPSSVSPLVHALTHSRAQLSHWPWFPAVTVCVRVVGRAFLLSVLEILLIQLIHTNKQTDTRVDGQREGRTDGQTQGFSIMWLVSPGVHPGRLAHLPFVSV